MRTTESGQSPLLLLDVLGILKKKRIDYAVIGAMAASFYGVVRASLDADAVIPLALPALPSLETTFKKAGFRTELRRGDLEDPIGALLAIEDRFGNRVDLLVGIRGMDPDAFSRTVKTIFQGQLLRMISLEDFIAMKMFAGSMKDIEDARNAVAISGQTLNRPLLEKIARRFGKKTQAAVKALF